MKRDRAAAALREFALRFKAHHDIAESLDALGDIVLAQERAEAALDAALKAESVARERAAAERGKLDELMRKYHNAVAEVRKDRRVKIG